MDIYIPLGLLLAFICFVFRRQNSGVVFTLVFVVILLFSAIRFGFGPDYYSYWDIWESVRGMDTEDYLGVGSGIEPLFLKFLSLFPRYTYFIILTSILLVSSYYWLFRRYVNMNDLWIVILFIFFNVNCLISNYVALRSSISAILFILAFHFLENRSIRNTIVYLLLILLASQIHSSSIVLLVFVLLNHKNNSVLFSWYFVIGAGVFAIITVLIGNNLLVSWGSSFLIDNIESFDRYRDYDVGNVSTSVMALLFRVISLVIFVFLVHSAKEENDKQMVLVYKIAVVAASLQLVFGQSLISDRYLLFLNPFYITAIVHSLRKRVDSIRAIMLVLVLGISVYLFWVKMGKDYSVSFLHYQTIFTQQIIP